MSLKTKKILAFVLCVVLLIGIVPINSVLANSLINSGDTVFENLGGFLNKALSGINASAITFPSWNNKTAKPTVTYDEETNTYYSYGRYTMTSTHEVVNIYGYSYMGEPQIMEVVTEDGSTRPINSSDTFEVYSGEILRVINGVVYTACDRTFPQVYYSFQGTALSLYNCTTLDSYYLYAGGLYDGSFMREYDVLLMYDYENSSLWYFTDIYDTLTELIKTDITKEDYYHQDGSYISNIADINPAFVPHLLLENCQVSDNHKQFEQRGLSSYVYYDIVVERVDGEVSVRALVSGTYDRSQLTIVLQPINR